MLIASNHQSFLDPLLIGMCLNRPAAYMARSTLFRFGPFGWVLRKVSAFPVKRGGADLGAVREALSRLRAGWAVVLFPEGTRTHDGRIHPLRPGFVSLVRRAGVPVVPAVIDGAFEAWPRRQKLFRPHKIYVGFGRPIWPEQDRDAETWRRQVAEAMQDIRVFLRAKRAHATRRVLCETKRVNMRSPGM